MKKFIIAVSPPLVLVLLVLLVLSCAEKQWPPLEATARPAVAPSIAATDAGWWQSHLGLDEIEQSAQEAVAAFEKTDRTDADLDELRAKFDGSDIDDGCFEFTDGALGIEGVIRWPGLSEFCRITEGSK